MAVKKETYEQAMKRLEEIVAKIESDPYILWLATLLCKMHK